MMKKNYNRGLLNVWCFCFIEVIGAVKGECGNSNSITIRDGGGNHISQVEFERRLVLRSIMIDLAGETRPEYEGWLVDSSIRANHPAKWSWDWEITWPSESQDFNKQQDRMVEFLDFLGDIWQPTSFVEREDKKLKIRGCGTHVGVLINPAPNQKSKLSNSGAARITKIEPTEETRIKVMAAAGEKYRAGDPIDILILRELRLNQDIVVQHPKLKELIDAARAASAQANSTE